MFKMCGLYSVLQAVGILAVSFFVLLGVSRAETRGLKSFGRIISYALWIIAGLMIVMAVYGSLTGSYHGKYHHGFGKRGYFSGAPQMPYDHRMFFKAAGQ